jgi:PKD repeat protein
MKLAPYAGAAALVLAGSALSFAQLPNPTAPPHFYFETLIGGFNALVDFVPLAGGGLIVGQQDGVIRHFGANGSDLGMIADWRAEVGHHGERGLMSIEPIPGFVPDGGPSSWLYVYYTAGPDGPFGTNQQTTPGRLSRVRIQTVDVGGIPTLREVAGSQQILLGAPNADGTSPTAIPVLHESHMGGSIVFGSDGTLLLSIGDGASFINNDVGGDQPWGFDDFVHPVTGLKGPHSKLHDQGSLRAQDVRSPSGKVLRIDPHTGLGIASNPFFDGDPTSIRSRVWALGFRNPFRMARVPGTGSNSPGAGAPGWFVAADVGSSVWEELDIVRGGENFGWPCSEGATPSAFYQAHQPAPNPFGWVDCGTGAGVATGAALAIPRMDPALLAPSVHVGLDGTPKGGFLAVCVVGGQVYTGSAYPADYVGRYVFGDFAYGWVKAAAISPAGTITAVSDFLEGMETLLGVRVEPGTGDLLFAQRGNIAGGCRVLALRYGANEPPQPIVTWTSGAGGDPLAIAFDATGSLDADGDALSFTWNFGDGSPTVQGASPLHTYAAAGLFKVTVSVDDGFTTVTKDVTVVAGAGPVTVVAQPAEGTVATPGDVITLEGIALGPGGQPLTAEWRIDRFVDGAWALSHLVVPGATAAVAFDAPPGDSTDWFWRVRFVALQGASVVAERVVHVHPSTRVQDAAGTATPLAKVLELIPKGSQGFGSPDVEVWRDVVVPQVGAPANQQYATYHPLGGQTSAFDWVGYELSNALPAGTRMFALDFTEGIHVPQGGWFIETPTLQVRTGATWTTVQQVVVTPPYPKNGAGDDFRTYRFAFPPVEAQAIRLIGRPGGTERFVSVAELRLWVGGPPSLWADITADASAPLSSTLDFVPPGPQGFGSVDLERLRDGAAPPAGTTSVLAQVTSFHASDPGVPAYFGWRFDEPRTIVGLRFTEGLVIQAAGLPLGGWFTSLGVETRLSAKHPWQPVDALTVTPPYRNPGPLTLDYETFQLSFAPRVAREVRIVGPGGGVLGFAAASELRVLAPHGFDGGWISRTGLGLLGDKLTLASSTIPVPGMPFGMHVAGAPPAAPGLLAVAAGPAMFPYGEFSVLLDLVGLLLLPFPCDENGTADLVLQLPPNPSLVGFQSSFQALVLDFSVPGAVAASNALDMTVGSR